MIGRSALAGAGLGVAGSMFSNDSSLWNAAQGAAVGAVAGRTLGHGGIRRLGALGVTGRAVRELGVGDATRFMASQGVFSNRNLFTAGIAAGGTYGAVSDDTSVLGGAAIGAAAVWGGLGARRFARNFGIARAEGMGKGAASAAAFAQIGSASADFIGNTAVNTYGRVGFALGNFRQNWAGSAPGRASTYGR